MPQAGEVITFKYEYPAGKTEQARVSRLRPAGKMLFIHYQRRGTVQVKPDVFGLGGGREWAHLW